MPGPLGRSRIHEGGLIIHRGFDLTGAMKPGVHIGLDEIRVDEFRTMSITSEKWVLPVRDCVRTV